MKFIAIAALVATASAADKKQFEKCTKDDKCPSTDCCGTVSHKDTVASGNAKLLDAIKTTTIDVCFTKDKTTFLKTYSDAAKAADGDIFVPKDTNKPAEGGFKCLATTGAASLSAAAAVLAASFYMA